MLVLKEDVMPDVATDITIPEQEMEPEGPKQGAETGIANLIHDLLIDENEAVQSYNTAAANMQQYPELAKLMQDIASEELVHIGELQKALEVVSPNEVKIAEGEQEAQEKLDPGSPVDESLNESVSMDDVIHTLEEEPIVIRKDLFYDTTSDYDEEELEYFRSLGFLDGNNIIIPAGTTLTYMEASNPYGAGYLHFYVNGNEDDTFSITNDYDYVKQFFEASNKPEFVERMEEALNEDDIHPKFKKDYKNQYKQWDKEQERIRNKRAEFDDDFEMTDAKYNIDPDKWNELKDKLAGKESDFELKKRNGIEDKNYPFYVTFYSEYPIYEPAEGGYYYAGRNAEYSKGFDSLEDAQKFAEDEMNSDKSVEWQPIEIEGTVKGYKTNEKYIGEDQYITIESNNEYLGNEAGYEPYQ